MSKEITLFSRYKRMINLLWEDGQRRYTANELNTYVGIYENQTQWKRWNSNPFYTTRMYQTALKQLGCITKIKRGLWQINGPIPEWFGSFHINALSSKSALAELEKSSFYWQSLPPEHKVNPWTSSQVSNTLETAFNNTYNAMNIKPNFASYSIEDIVLTTKSTALTVDFEVNVWPKEDGTGIGGEVVDWYYKVNGTVVGVNTATDLCKAYGETLDLLMDRVKVEALDLAINQAKRDNLNATLDTVKAANTPAETELFTREDVDRILREFADHSRSSVETSICNAAEGIDESDMVEISLGSNYNYRELEVSLDTRSIGDAISNAVLEDFDNIFDDFTYEK